MEKLTISELLRLYPYANEFFDANGLPIKNKEQTVQGYIDSLPYTFLEDIGMDTETLLKRFLAFMQNMEDIRKGTNFNINSLTILGGTDKSGNCEYARIDITMGEVISILGPTGSGKSRLLADIEWMAQKDTPTGRQILIDGSIPPEKWRFSIEHKLVAQLSQNMNFVMDIAVGDFIKLHAQSRMVKDIEEKVRLICHHANELSGEAFDLDTPLTSLSGGQSRALMVADVAFLSTSPIVLIDEIENAGIDRKKALELLVGQHKIVLIATHDPLLALTADKRIIIKNGGIRDTLTTTENEKLCLARLTDVDKVMMQYRELLRSGASLDPDI